MTFFFYSFNDTNYFPIFPVQYEHTYCISQQFTANLFSQWFACHTFICCNRIFCLSSQTERYFLKYLTPNYTPSTRDLGNVLIFVSKCQVQRDISDASGSLQRERLLLKAKGGKFTVRWAKFTAHIALGHGGYSFENHKDKAHSPGA